MNLPRILAVLTGIALLVAVIGCSTTPPAEVAPTPNIDATVEARVKQEVEAQPTTTPIVVVKEVTPTDTPAPTNTPEPTSTPVPTAAPNPTSRPSSTLPPISMVLEEVSPELLACVQTALGDDQYNAIISGHQEVTSQQYYIFMPCIMQYPQETKAIMDMFGLDVGTIMGAGSPTPTAQPKPYTPLPTATPLSTATPVPTPTSVPTPTPTPVPTPVPTAAQVPLTTVSISLTPNSGRVGSIVHVRGVGFLPGVVIILYLYDGKSDTVAQMGGPSLGGTFRVPLNASIPSTNTVKAFTISDEDGTYSATATHTIPRPTVNISPGSGAPNSLVTVSGSGFKPFSSVTVMFGDKRITGAVTDDSGHFSTEIIVPPLRVGVHQVIVIIAGSEPTPIDFIVTAQ